MHIVWALCAVPATLLVLYILGFELVRCVNSCEASKARAARTRGGVSSSESDTTDTDTDDDGDGGVGGGGVSQSTPSLSLL